MICYVNMLVRSQHSTLLTITATLDPDPCIPKWLGYRDTCQASILREPPPPPPPPSSIVFEQVYLQGKGQWIFGSVDMKL